MFYTNTFARKGVLHVRGYDDSGKRVSQAIEMIPEIFRVDKNSSDAVHRTIHGEPLVPVAAGNWFEVKATIKDYENSGIPVFFNRRMEYGEIFRNFKDQVVDDSKIRVAVLDIETEVETGGNADPENTPERVNAIGIHVGKQTVCFCFNGVDAAHAGVKYKSLIEGHSYRVVECSSEKELLQNFLAYWDIIDVDIVTGWYVEGFDIPYLYNRITKLLGEDKANQLSPHRVVSRREIKNKFGVDVTYDIAGISVLDLLPAYKKFRKSSADSWKLSDICQDELGVGKLEDGGYLLYREDFSEFVAYNIRDVELVLLLNHKTKLLELIRSMAYSAFVNYKDAFSQVKLWDCICSNDLYRENIITNGSRREHGSADMVGGFVMEPKPGLYSDVVIYDVASEYPSLMIQFNMSPETLVRGKKREAILNDWLNYHEARGNGVHMRVIKKLLAGDQLSVNGDELFACDPTIGIVPATETKYTMTAKGVIFSLEKPGFLATILKKKFEERAAIKKLMLQKEQELELIKGQLKELQ